MTPLGVNTHWMIAVEEVNGNQKVEVAHRLVHSPSDEAAAVQLARLTGIYCQAISSTSKVGHNLITRHVGKCGRGVATVFNMVFGQVGEELIQIHNATQELSKNHKCSSKSHFRDSAVSR